MRLIRGLPLAVAPLFVWALAVTPAFAQAPPAQPPPSEEEEKDEGPGDDIKEDEPTTPEGKAQKNVLNAQEIPPKETPPQEAPAPEAPAQEKPVQQPQVQAAPAQPPIAYERVPRKAKIFVEGSETVDASNSKNKATYGDFTVAITAALTKKKVPVIVVTDPERADFLVRHTSSAKEDSTGTKVAKIVVMGGLWGSSKFEASIMVIDKASTAVVFSYNVKKGNFQSAAEAFAKHLNNHIEGGK